MRTLRSVTGIAACVAMLAAVGCEGEPDVDHTNSTTGSDVETELAKDVEVDIVANGSRLEVRNDRPQDILVLDTAINPDRADESGVLRLTYSRPGGAQSGDEPAIFEAVLVAAEGTATIDPPHTVSTGDRLRYCLEVVDPAESIGGDETRVRDRKPGEPAVLACSSPVTVR